MIAMCPNCKKMVKVYITSDGFVQDFYCPSCKKRLSGNIVKKVDLYIAEGG